MALSYDKSASEWELLVRSLEANAADLPHLEIPRANLQGLLEQARTLANQQDFHRANWLQASRKLQELLDLGQKLATFLRVGIRQFYGRRSDKLVEFGIQPFRGLRKAAPEEPAEVKPEPKPDTKES